MRWCRASSSRWPCRRRTERSPAEPSRLGSALVDVREQTASGVVHPAGGAGWTARVTMDDGPPERADPRTTGGAVPCAVNRPVPAPGVSPAERSRAVRTPDESPAPASPRESAVVDRRRASLTALSTLARRPRPELTLAPAPQPPAPVAPQRQSLIVDNAVYSSGRRVATPDSVAESHEWLVEGPHPPVWVGALPPQPRGARGAGG